MFNRFRPHALALALVATLFTPALARQQTLGPLAPQPSPGPNAPADCAVGVLAIVPLATTSNGQDYAAYLWSPDGAGLASGTIWVTTDTAGSYRVPFQKRLVLGADFTGDLDPITFRLGKSAKPISAFIESIDDPAPGPCQVFSSWAPGMTAHLRPDLAARFAAVTPPPATVPSLVAGRSPVCRSGDEPLRTLLEAIPPNKTSIAGSVDVSIHVEPDSTVSSAKIKDSTNPQLDAVALDAAKNAVFATAIRQCLPIATDAIYIVRFTAKSTPSPAPAH